MDWSVMGIIELNTVSRDNCVLCKSKYVETVIVRDFIHESVLGFLKTYYKEGISKYRLPKEEYEILKCTSCGFIWQKNILDEAGMYELYSNIISTEDSFNKKKKAEITLFNTYAKEVALISILLNKKPYQINVLDYGMGWGYWALMAKAHGYNSYGFELSKERTKFARTNAIHVISSLDKLKDEKFDYINANQVFEHLSDPLACIIFLAKILEKNGITKISVPDGSKIKNEVFDSKWVARKNYIHPLEHINCFSTETLIFMAEKAGLKYLCGSKAKLFFIRKDNGLDQDLLLKNLMQTDTKELNKEKKYNIKYSLKKFLSTVILNEHKK